MKLTMKHDRMELDPENEPDRQYLASFMGSHYGTSNGRATVRAWAGALIGPGNDNWTIVIEPGPKLTLDEIDALGH